MNEYFNRESRKQNLVIYGLPESEGSDTSDQNMSDANAFSRLVSSQFKIENINIAKNDSFGKNKP